MYTLKQRLWGRAASFEPRGSALSVARSLLALAQLTFMLYTPDRLLTLGSPVADSSTCSGAARLTLWCVTPSSPVFAIIDRSAVLTVLVGVLIGFCPRWLCIPHWYVSFSLAVDVLIADGGFAVAQILTALIIPACLGDDRIWQWRRLPQRLSERWRGSSYAAHLLLRAQVAVIYLTAAISKLEYHSWRNGSALRAIMLSPEYSVAPQARPLIANALSMHALTAALTWGAVATELAIGVSMLLPVRWRRWGLGLGAGLHGSIMLGLGLFSFGLTMVSLLLSVQAEPSSQPLLSPLSSKPQEVNLYDTGNDCSIGCVDIPRSGPAGLP